MDTNDETKIYPPYVIATLIPGSDSSSESPCLSYRCNFCHFAAQSKSAITSHSNQHIFRCSQCEYVTYMQHRLLEHKELKHGKSSHPIPYDLLTLDRSHRIDISSPPRSFRSFQFPLKVIEKFKHYKSSGLVDTVQTAKACKSNTDATSAAVVCQEPAVSYDKTEKLCKPRKRKPKTSSSKILFREPKVILPTASQTEINTHTCHIDCEAIPVHQSDSITSVTVEGTAVDSREVQISSSELCEAATPCHITPDHASARQPTPTHSAQRLPCVIELQSKSEVVLSEGMGEASVKAAVHSSSNTAIHDMPECEALPSVLCSNQPNISNYFPPYLSPNIDNVETYIENGRMTMECAGAEFSSKDIDGAENLSYFVSAADNVFAASHTAVNGDKLEWNSLNYVELLVVHERLHKVKKWLASQKPPADATRIKSQTYKIVTEVCCSSTELVYEFVNPCDAVETKSAKTKTARIRKPSGKKRRLISARVNQHPELRNGVDTKTVNTETSTADVCNADTESCTSGKLCYSFSKLTGVACRKGKSCMFMYIHVYLDEKETRKRFR